MTFGTLQNDKSQRQAIQSLLDGTATSLTLKQDATLAPGALGPGSVEREVVEVLSERISAKSYLTSTDGSADQSTQLTNALSAAGETGRQLWVPGDVTIRLDSPIFHTASPLDLILDGKLLLPEQAGGLYIAPATSASTTVSAISTVEHPASSGRYVTRLTVASTSGWARNARAFLAGTNNYTADANLAHKVAEILSVLYVDSGNSHIYLDGQIADTPTGTVTVRRLSDYRVSIDGRGTIEYRSDVWAVADGLQTGYGAIVLEGCVGAIVNCRLRNLLGVGVRSVSSFDCDINVIGSDLRNNDANQYLGYVGVDTTASRANRWHIRARNIRHAYTTVMYDRPGYPLWDAGAPRENVVSGIACNATSAAWDTHPGAYDTVFRGIHVRGALRDDQSPSGTQYAVQDRGCNTTVDGLTVIGSQINLLYNSGHATIYGRDNVLRLNNVYARNTDVTHKPAFFVGTSRIFEASIRKETVFTNLEIQYYNIDEVVGAAAPIKISKARIILPTTLRLGGTNDWTLTDIYLETNGSTEPFGLKDQTTLRVYGMEHNGAIFLSQLFRASAGVSTLAHRDVRSYTAGVALTGAAGGATVIVTKPRVLDEVTALTSNATLAVGQCNGCSFSNVGATGTVTATLPASVAGMVVTFYRSASQAFRIDPNGSEIIGTGGAGKYLELQTDKGFVRLECLVAGSWIVTAVVGTVAYEP